MIERERVTSQTLEWLMLIDEEQDWLRTRSMLDRAYVTRAAACAPNDFQDYARALKKSLKR